MNPTGNAFTVAFPGCATRGVQVKAAMAERFDLTNVTSSSKESPGLEPTPVPSE